MNELLANSIGGELEAVDSTDMLGLFADGAILFEEVLLDAHMIYNMMPPNGDDKMDAAKRVY